MKLKQVSTLIYITYHKDHKEVMNYVNSQVNQRVNQKQQQGNTKLVDRCEYPDENDTNIVPDRGKDPYP